MTDVEIQEAIKADRRFKIDGHINTVILQEGLRNARYYKDMDSTFLHSVKTITGTVNGIYVTDSTFHLVVSTEKSNFRNPVVSFDLVFDKGSGLHIGFDNILYVDKLNPTEDTGVYCDETTTNNIFEQILDTIRVALSNARKLNYYFPLEATTYGKYY